MRILSRIGIVSLFAIGAFLVAGAAAGEAEAAPPLKASVKLPGKVKAGQKIDVDITCLTIDTKAIIHVKGDDLSIGTILSLSGGKASLSVTIPAKAPKGKYDINLICAPSSTKASAVSSVTD